MSIERSPLGQHINSDENIQYEKILHQTNVKKNLIEENYFDKTELLECAVCSIKVTSLRDLYIHAKKHKILKVLLLNSVLPQDTKPISDCHIVEDSDDSNFICGYCNLKMNKCNFVSHLKLHMVESGFLDSSPSTVENKENFSPNKHKLLLIGMIKDEKSFFLGKNKLGKTILFSANHNGKCAFWELKTNKPLSGSKLNFSKTKNDDYLSARHIVYENKALVDEQVKNVGYSGMFKSFGKRGRLL